MSEQEEAARRTRIAVLFGRLTSLSSGEDKFWFKRDEIADVASGDSHAAVLTVSGQLFMLGANEWGQLGVGHTRSLAKPVHVKALETEHLMAVACGQTHTLVASGSGHMFSFGGGQYGQLGCGEVKSALQPIQVRGVPQEKYRMVACSAFSSAAVTEKGKLFMWGSNSEGQLGIEVTEANEPMEVVLNATVHFVSCGNYHTVVISDAGEVIVFGESEGGKLGLGGEPLPLVVKPTVLRGLPPVCSAACGTSHTLFLTRDGKALVCGSGEQGQLGLGPSHLGPCDTPTPVGDLQDVKVSAVSSGATHCAVVSSSGFLLTFGDGYHGKLCHRQDHWYNVFQPQLVEIGGEVIKVACGGVHTLVLLQPTLERNVLCQPTGTSPEQSLNDSSQSSSLTSTVHRYQGFLNLRTSPSPPHSLSSSHSSSQPLPPISVARKRRRALKQQTHSSAVDYSHLGETGSVSTPGSGPYPGSDVTGDNGGDISDIEVTDTELSDEGTATEAVDGGTEGGHLGVTKHELVVSSGLSESEDDAGGKGAGAGGGGEGGGGGGEGGSQGANVTTDAPLKGDTLSYNPEVLEEERVTEDEDDLDSEEEGVSVDGTGEQDGYGQDGAGVDKEPAPQLRVFQEPPQVGPQQGAPLTRRLQFWKKSPPQQQQQTTRNSQTGHTRSSLCLLI